MKFAAMRGRIGLSCALLAGCAESAEGALDSSGEPASNQADQGSPEPAGDDPPRELDGGPALDADEAPPASDASDAAAAAANTQALEVYFLFVHGVQNCNPARESADRSLRDLDAALQAELPARIAAYEAAHPGLKLAFQSAHANLYTAPASGIQPSDSSDPLLMDDWEAGDPGCSAQRQGEPCTTAYEWRYRLAEEIRRKIPDSAKNIVLVGHSTGGRAAFEVAANAGADGVNSEDWGVQARIAGVVSVHGMLDALGSEAYDNLGPFSFVTSCKNGEAVLGFGDSCAHGNGWCEYAGEISGFEAADWVASEKRALMLTGFSSCSPSLFSGQTDGPLPIDAQASSRSAGLTMTTAPGQTLRPAHGVRYGSFCHSTITSGSADGHAQAVEAATSRILDWLFVSAPRVLATGNASSPSLARDELSPSFPIASALVPGWTRELGAGTGGVEAAGVCRHPGFFDGDDHAIADEELTLELDAAGNPSLRWQQAHDSDNAHAAELFWKLRAVRAERPELLGALSPN